MGVAFDNGSSGGCFVYFADGHWVGRWQLDEVHFEDKFMGGGGFFAD